MKQSVRGRCVDDVPLEDRGDRAEGAVDRVAAEEELEGQVLGLIADGAEPPVQAAALLRQLQKRLRWRDLQEVNGCLLEPLVFRCR